MRYIATIVVGYLLGSINPAALVSRIKNKDIRESGTGNLGATNTLLNFGKAHAAFVMLFDMMKAVAAFHIAKYLLPTSSVSGLIGGGAAVLGHVFPFYLKFKGGKGLAAFAGLVLAYDPTIFMILLVISTSLMLIFNYSVAMPMSATVLFPIMAGLRDGSLLVFFVASLVCVFVAFKHRENLVKAVNGTDIKVREYIKEHLFKDDERTEEHK